MNDNNKSALGVLGAIIGLNLDKFLPEPYGAIGIISLGAALSLWSVFFAKQIIRPFRVMFFLLTFPVTLYGANNLLVYLDLGYLSSINLTMPFLIIYGVILFFILPFILHRYGDERQQKYAKLYITTMWVVLLLVATMVYFIKYRE